MEEMHLRKDLNEDSFECEFFQKSYQKRFYIQRRIVTAFSSQLFSEKQALKRDKGTFL